VPFIAAQDQTKPVEVKVKIRPEVMALAKEYATFVPGDLDYVVQEVLRKVFETDKDFQRWIKAKSEQSATPAKVKAA